ncbi:hypothetical protein Misp01_05130 [Microtetraspora sp. NBRC 13810]|uniref:LCP family protein n=1 Tax=Microtetraspora sp. NBRC 13810 TaxID=3030990 RepID=UPI0024A5AD2E|nr:LCP family protein [Microtetraspora sp. NBRC 13810]GLW05383.1 hypothetical protein Misp01_05130 [Microtetraspora sp. NBRC 13810]
MSERRHGAVQDQRVSPAGPETGRRGSRRAHRDLPTEERAPGRAAGRGAGSGMDQRVERSFYEDPPRPGERPRPPRRGQAPEAPEPQFAEPPYDDPPKGRRRKDGDGGGGKMRVLAWGSIALTGLMVAGTLTGYTFYRSLLSGVETEDIEGKLGNNRPVNATGALNVLLVGSDTREGDNLRYGQKMANAGKRTDTMILMHISPNRDNATLISFPRDSMVQIPSCVADNGTQLAPRTEMINAAYNEGGIACTVKTLESLTKIRIDHFVEVDFTGFKNIVNALDGIRVCLKEPVDDKASKLKLDAGWHNLRGEAALGYVRLRHYGNGSDIDRIKRQQVFLSQVVKKATSSDLITDPTKLIGFIRAATASVKMDPQLANNTETLIQIAQSARALTSSGVKFVTIPWAPWPENPNRVIWKEPQATQLFDRIRSDIEVTPTSTPKPSAAASSSSAPAKPAIKPAQVQIQVINGTSVSGRAQTVADALTEQGFTVTEIGNAPLTGGDQAKTRLLFPKNAADGADYAAPVAGKLIKKVTPASGKIKPATVQPYVVGGAAGQPAVPTAPATPAQPAAGGTPVIQLVIGSDWEGVSAPVKIPDELKDNVVDSKTNVCQ